MAFGELILWSMGIGLALGVLIAWGRADYIKRRAEELDAEATITLGKYVAGLPEAPIAVPDVTCLVTGGELVVVGGAMIAAELGRIPRSSVLDIFVEDRSLVAQRLTVPRIAVLGFFSLAAPKKSTHSNYCMVLDWTDAGGVRQNTVFAWEGVLAASLSQKAYSELSKLVKPSGIAPGERACPFCAETIKRAAVKCRYCGSEIPPVPEPS